MITNRLVAGSIYDTISTLIAEDVRDDLLKYSANISYLWLVFYELLGYGTRKIMIKQSEGSFNFDWENPPLNPLTGKSIDLWY